MLSAAVHVDEERIAEIGRGLVVLLGVGATDRPEDGERLAGKLAGLRVFDDDRGRMGRDLAAAEGAVMVVPQFTLYADVRGGRRPDLGGAADAARGQRLYEAFCGVLRGKGLKVAEGRFGARMRVSLEAEGPVTIVMSTDGWAEGEVAVTPGRAPAPSPASSGKP